MQACWTESISVNQKWPLGIKQNVANASKQKREVGQFEGYFHSWLGLAAQEPAPVDHVMALKRKELN